MFYFVVDTKIAHKFVKTLKSKGKKSGGDYHEKPKYR